MLRRLLGLALFMGLSCIPVRFSRFVVVRGGLVMIVFRHCA